MNIKIKTIKNGVVIKDCSKYISDTIRHFQSEIHLRIKQKNQRNQQNTICAFGNFSIDTRSTQSASFR